VLIKEADDRTGHLEALEALLHRDDLDHEIGRRIEREIRLLRGGIAGEREAAYVIDFDMARSNNWAVIHDLRLDVDGRVAQIDHLIINRLLDTWVCESKHFTEGVSVNEHGEWTGFAKGRPFAVPSPIEQNRRHLAVLEDVFSGGLVPLPRRLGMVAIRPRLRSLVLVSNTARITRPKAATARFDGLEQVIKADLITTTVRRDFDERSSLAMAKVVSKDQLERFARALATLHAPGPFDYAAKFGLPAEPAPAAVTTPVEAAVVAPEVLADEKEDQREDGHPTCVSCGRPVSQAVVEYCEAHAHRFAGRVYCYRCQRTPSRRS
jgi:hypothetical protein